MAKTYQCQTCRGIFEAGWTDEEALQELKDNFGDIPTDQCGVVCDDCYNKIMSYGNENNA